MIKKNKQNILPKFRELLGLQISPFSSLFNYFNSANFYNKKGNLKYNFNIIKDPLITLNNLLFSSLNKLAATQNKFFKDSRFASAVPQQQDSVQAQKGRAVFKNKFNLIPVATIGGCRAKHSISPLGAAVAKVASLTFGA